MPRVPLHATWGVPCCVVYGRYLTEANANVYAAMTAADPRSVYVMQGWLFLNTGFWTSERVQAYLAGVPVGGMLILDLYSDGSPQWSRFNSYFGHNWIWNSLIVFGGRRGLYGTLDSLANSPYDDRAKSASLIGIGVTPEAIDMSQPMFDITFEAGWRASKPDPRAWLQQYAVRRYGRYSFTMAAATDLMYHSAYQNSGIDTSIIETVPGSESGSRNTNATGILSALRLYHAAFASGELDANTGPASYDLTDLTRQVLSNLFQEVYTIFSTRKHAYNLRELTDLSAALLGIVSDIDDTNAADVNFLLGNWLADAATWGFNESQVRNRLFNARNQVTLWGPNGEINDYAAKNGWSGLVRDYYGYRWENYTSYLLACVASGTTPDWDSWGKALLGWEQQWGLSTKEYPTKASGQKPLDQAGAMLHKYFSNDLNGYTPHTGYDAGDRPAPPQWFKVPNSDGSAAVGADCPWVSKGSDDSLAACETSCIDAPGCNAVNWNPTMPDCELRRCADALTPSLTPGFSGYMVYANAADGGSIIGNMWLTDLPALAYLCDLTPACVGFTSKGLISGNATVLSPSPGVTYYSKNSAVAPSDILYSAGSIPAAPARVDPYMIHQPLPSPFRSMAAAAQARRHRRPLTRGA